MRKILIAVLILAAAPSAVAKEVDIDCNGCQAAFETMAEDLIAAIDYKAVGPAEATGIAGFGIGLVATVVPVDEDAWDVVTQSSEFSSIGMVGLQANKGLPFGIDVGVYYATAPGANVDVLGGELRYAFLEGGAATPAVALRLSHVVVSGLDDFDLDSTSLDLSVSKGFGPFTPYAGVGFVQGAAEPSAAVTAATNVGKAEVEETKFFVGARLSLGIIEFTPQFDQVGDATSYSLRMGFSFGL